MSLGEGSTARNRHAHPAGSSTLGREFRELETASLMNASSRAINSGALPCLGCRSPLKVDLNGAKLSKNLEWRGLSGVVSGAKEPARPPEPHDVVDSE